MQILYKAELSNSRLPYDLEYQSNQFHMIGYTTFYNIVSKKKSIAFMFKIFLQHLLLLHQNLLLAELGYYIFISNLTFVAYTDPYQQTHHVTLEILSPFYFLNANNEIELIIRDINIKKVTIIIVNYFVATNTTILVKELLKLPKTLQLIFEERYFIIFGLAGKVTFSPSASFLQLF